MTPFSLPRPTPGSLRLQDGEGSFCDGGGDMTRKPTQATARTINPSVSRQTVRLIKTASVAESVQTSCRSARSHECSIPARRNSFQAAKQEPEATRGSLKLRVHSSRFASTPALFFPAPHPIHLEAA